MKLVMVLEMCPWLLLTMVNIYWIFTENATERICPFESLCLLKRRSDKKKNKDVVEPCWAEGNNFAHIILRIIQILRPFS